MIKAVVFDMDGVLVDTEPVYIHQNYITLKDKFPWVTEEALLPTIGMSAKMYHAFMAELLRLEPNSEEYWVANALTNQNFHIDYKTIMRPDVIELLTKLKQMNIKTAIASSNSFKYINRVIEDCGLNPYLDFVTSGDMFVQSKPNPEIYLTTFAKLGCKPEECFVIEDSPRGIEAGVASGATTFALREERFGFDQSQAHHMIDHLSDVVGYLARQIKAVFFDGDGTLSNIETHQVPESARLAISKLQEKGIQVFLCTGRNEVEMRVSNMLQDIDFDGYIYCSGQICKYKDKYISQRFLSREQLLQLKKVILENNICALVYTMDDFYCNYVSEGLIRMQNEVGSPIPEVRSFEHLEDEETFLVVPLVDEKLEQRIIDSAQGVKTLRWTDEVIDVIACEGGKDAGILDICKAIGIDVAETMSFGDGDNDIPMLKLTGLSVAMGNGKLAVKQVADFVTDDYDQDGILKALQYFRIISTHIS